MEKLRQLLSGSDDQSNVRYYRVCALVTSLLPFVNIDKTNMENDCAFAYLEDKYTFILQIIKIKDMCAMYTIGMEGAVLFELPFIMIISREFLFPFSTLLGSGCVLISYSMLSLIIAWLG
jgi:hypothetical protein